MASLRFYSQNKLIFSARSLIQQNVQFRQICRRKHVLCFEANSIRDTLKYNRSQLLLRCSPASAGRLASTFVVEVDPANTSTKTSVVEDTILPPIPSAPPITSDTTAEVVNGIINAEPTFQSIGLGGWSPVGIVQQALEYAHISCGLPWWLSIAAGTLVIRTLVFPLVILAQRSAARMNNHLPQMQVLQMKMTEARQTGNQFEAARYGQELLLFMNEKQISPFKSMLPPLAQAPVFISMFIGLRGMANVPVDSLRTGGLFWFQDLTIPDPYFVLPVITSLTLWVTIELGTDTGKLTGQMHMMKYVLRALPVVIFPFTFNFPAAILCYWVSTNFISLIQVGVLKIPRVRDYFKIPTLINHPKENLPIQDKGFVRGFKESVSNMKVAKELQDRENFDAVQFSKAGRVPIQRTFKQDPTKKLPIQAQDVLAKKRE